MATELGDSRWAALLGEHETIVRSEVERFRGRVVDFHGDGAFASFDGPAKAIRCASAIREALRALGLEIRAGVHTGEVEVRGDDLSGVGVHIGARVAANAEPGEILVSRTVVDLVAGSQIAFADRGAQPLKGVSGEWRLFAVSA
jgi:class 3 adenylate cyclase